ncbi:sn-glycerol-3-phosphate import ATP-binding protein UgpC [Pontiella desulfatans]|uniref:sn-glycerol-3-phosphate import ATP-binding protein UgpC n=1 Tax=Pontiella desulfatans TaxID=2750659 RepID=A0A6C2TZR0_PONDE|nr:sn-glycerol-3-phosphate ABC transporter ATP-binding protein UgpC [Pontiella desulfatans]VGO13093.1 sn-glycerol-3-phosphate import ATP-binding protein UgpC [Pontiella desulfatans]
MGNVAVNGVSKQYDNGYVAVKDFNLNIADGEFMVLVGPSGCGKSTMLRMIAGLEEITSGTIGIGERVVNDVLPKDRDIAMVFQNYALYPHMSVAENMAFGLKLRKFTKIEINRRVDAVAKILGLELLLKRKPKALSGGQRQRVAMGRAMVREPSVFLFDEPLSNLDAKMRVEMRKEILRLHRRISATMIYVTHDQVEAMTLGDRICVMNEGAIEQVGVPTAIFEHPASLFVARFIGTPPMNVFEGVLEEDEDGLAFVSGGIHWSLPNEKAVMLNGYGGRKVCLGIRPRALRLGTGTGALEATVEVSEMLGEEMLHHLVAGDHRFIVSANPHEAAAYSKDAVAVVADLSAAHVFDAESGINLTLVN